MNVMFQDRIGRKQQAVYAAVAAEQAQFHSCDKLNALFVSMQDKALKGGL